MLRSINSSAKAGPHFQDAIPKLGELTIDSTVSYMERYNEIRQKPYGVLQSFSCRSVDPWDTGGKLMKVN
eukprot:4385060-Pleurochrysis_carterae.AAC.4